MPDDPNDQPNADAQAAEGEAPEAQQPNDTADGQGDAPEAFDREYVEKLRSENAKRRKEAQDLKAKLEENQKEAERAKLDEVERVKAEKADLEQQLQAANDAARQAGWKASLSGRVANADAALKLLDEEKHVTEDGQVNVDALLADYDFLAPQQPGKSPVTPANTGGSKDGPLGPDDFKGKDKEWVRRNMHRLKKPSN